MSIPVRDAKGRFVKRDAIDEPMAGIGARSVRIYEMTQEIRVRWWRAWLCDTVGCRLIRTPYGDRCRRCGETRDKYDFGRCMADVIVEVRGLGPRLLRNVE